MLLLYRQRYASRYRSVAELIPAGASVLDVCCGPAVLYTRYLKNKRVSYIGIDINDKFVAAGRAKGLTMIHGDVAKVAEFPKVDFVIMQASLYHFLPDDVSSVVEKMLRAAKQTLIIAEPVHNVSSSSFRLLARMAQRLAEAGDAPCPRRCSAGSWRAAVARTGVHLEWCFPIAGGRWCVYILGPGKGKPAAAGRVRSGRERPVR